MERLEIRLVIRQRNWCKGTKEVNNIICVSIVYSKQLRTCLVFSAGASELFFFSWFGMKDKE